jgi:phosphoglycolate phosphatase-like HAD superfamily hydrolase
MFASLLSAYDTIMRASILFDIDGTLLYARGIGRAAFDVAFKDAYGVPYPDIAGLTFVGATDSAVVRDMAAACGVESTPAREAHFFSLLARIIDGALATNRPHLYPGVPALTRRLNERGHALGLVTGNVRATAWSKLRHAGLDADFSFGAYGDDHHLRPEITRIAISRSPADAAPRMLIGDTPLDVHAAKANGLVAIAVATGWISADELAAAGADLVIPDFADTDARISQLEALL